MKSAVYPLNQRNLNGQLVRCTGPRKEVSGGKRRIGGGYAQNCEIANETVFGERAERPIQRVLLSTGCGPGCENRLAQLRADSVASRCSPCGERKLAQLRTDSVASLRDFQDSRRHRWKRRLRLARGGKAAIQRLRLADRLTRIVTSLAVPRLACLRVVTVTPR